jgi:PAS domain S-box-containing protein
MDMIGYQLEDKKGLSWWLRRIHPEDRNRVSDNVKDTTEKNLQSWEDEYQFKCADGTYKHMHDKGYVVYENGLPVKMIGSLRDVSGLKDLENKLMEEKLQRQKEISRFKNRPSLFAERRRCRCRGRSSRSSRSSRSTQSMNDAVVLCCLVLSNGAGVGMR